MTFSYRPLEFDRVRDALADQASTRLGRARALALEPAVAPDIVRHQLEPHVARGQMIRIDHD